jgi:hypothetical protein
MFSITKLDSTSQGFISELSSSNASRNYVSSLCLAKALTHCSLLPTTPVDDVNAFYRTHVQVEIERKVNGINELLVLDTATVIDLSMKFYMLRYTTAHPKCHVFTFNKDTALEDFFGISRIFDAVTIKTIKENSDILSYRINRFSSMLEQLFETTKEPA